MTKPLSATERQKLLDELYEKIARKDLSFGCKVIVDTKRRTNRFKKAVFFNHTDSGAYYRYENGKSPQLHARFDVVRIIGHEPHLEDVLVALGKKYNYSFVSDGYIILEKENGQMMDMHTWILGKTLSNQSDETIVKLHNLLCKPL